MAKVQQIDSLMTVDQRHTETKQGKKLGFVQKVALKVLKKRLSKSQKDDEKFQISWGVALLSIALILVGGGLAIAILGSASFLVGIGIFFIILGCLAGALMIFMKAIGLYLFY